MAWSELREKRANSKEELKEILGEMKELLHEACELAEEDMMMSERDGGYLDSEQYRNERNRGMSERDAYYLERLNERRGVRGTGRYGRRS